MLLYTLKKNSATEIISMHSDICMKKGPYIHVPYIDICLKGIIFYFSYVLIKLARYIHRKL